MGPVTINRKYRGRILKFLRNIAKYLREKGYVVDEPFDMSCDEYWYSLIVRRESKAGEDTKMGDVDISVKICESEQHDGCKNGINFSIDIVGFGGAILGGFTPFNYTGECWVDRRDHEALEKRFLCLEELEIDGIATLLVDDDHPWPRKPKPPLPKFALRK